MFSEGVSGIKYRPWSVCSELTQGERSTECKLLDAKGQGPQVAEWERELHALVCEMCGLTEEEIAIVKGLDHE